MTTEIEITVRAMTPRKDSEPLYTAEKFIDVGQVTDIKFLNQLMINTHALLERAANTVITEVINRAQEEKTQQARDADAAEYDNDFKAEF